LIEKLVTMEQKRKVGDDFGEDLKRNRMDQLEDDNIDLQDNGSPFDDADELPTIPRWTQVIKKEELAMEMKNSTLEVQQKFAISESGALVLLNHFSWNKEKLFTKLFND